MNFPLEIGPAQAQRPAGAPAFDSWITPEGAASAEFRRIAGGYHVRFPAQADFAIAFDPPQVRAWPVPGGDPGTVETLYANAILPLIGNHLGRLNLHGSAVATEAGAVAFLGQSRRGKTTLAGAFAAHGHPFLSEDVLALSQAAGTYQVAPQRPLLRLFHDSAAHLVGPAANWGASEKNELDADDRLPHCAQPQALRAICVLGPGKARKVALHRLGEAEALAELFRHAFVLDVEDRPRLRAHFERLGELAARVPVHALDYPRRYAQLPRVIAAVIAATVGDEAGHAAD